MTTPKFEMIRDINGYNSYGIHGTTPDSVINGVFLAPNVAQDLITLPSDQRNYTVIFSQTPGTDIFVDPITTAVSYSGAAGAVTAEHNPQSRAYAAGTTLSVITPSAGGSYVSATVEVIAPFTN